VAYARVLAMQDWYHEGNRLLDFVQTVQTNDRGEYRLFWLPPGDYRVFSWESVADFAWQDPAFMRDYEDRGRAVRVTAGARQTVDLEKN
jgi:hypothetical protein